MNVTKTPGPDILWLPQQYRQNKREQTQNFHLLKNRTQLSTQSDCKDVGSSKIRTDMNWTILQKVVETPEKNDKEDKLIASHVQIG